MHQPLFWQTVGVEPNPHGLVTDERMNVAEGIWAVGDVTGQWNLTHAAHLSGVARTATYTREYATRPGFLTLVSDGEVLTGAYAIGPEAGEWLQRATLAIRAVTFPEAA